MNISKCKTPDKAQQKEENRRNFPATAQILDGVREVFGPGVRLVWASEQGREIGKRPTLVDEVR